jgi:O-antigen/teichoic acid export membrane protein
MSRTKRALHGTVTSFAQVGLQMLLQLMLAPVVLHFAGQETLGAYAVIAQVLGYLALVEFGFSVALGRYLANAHGVDDGGRRFTNILTMARSYYLGTNLIYATLAGLLAIYIGPLLKLNPAVTADAQWSIILLALWVVARTPMEGSMAGLMGIQDLAFCNIVGAVANTVRLGLSLLLVWRGLGLLGLMLGNIGADMLNYAVCCARLRRLRRDIRPGWGIPDRALFFEMVKYGSGAIMINVTVRLVLYTGNIIVGTFLSAAWAGVYYVTQMPAVLAWNMLMRLTDSATPAINELHARTDLARLQSAYLRLHRYNLLLALPLASGLLFLNHAAIKLWVGEARYGGALMTASLAVFAVVLMVGHVDSAFVMATGRIRALAVLGIICGVTNLVLAIILIQRLGVGGVSLAALFPNIPLGVWVNWRARQTLGLTLQSLWRESLLPALGPGAAGTVVLWWLCREWPPITWMVLLAIVGAFLVLYGLMCLGVLKPEDRRLAFHQIGLIFPPARWLA